MALRIFNVLGREKQPFVPMQEGRVGIYVCGPTVYDHSHMGHAKTYLAFDMIVRYLRFRGYDVLYVQNITDVGHLTDDADAGEDKILRRAAMVQSGPMQLVERYARSYFEDMDALGVVRPDISPRASGHIPEQIAMIETLLAKGHAYQAGGNVYFDVTSAPDYGKLSNRRFEDQAAGTREDVRDEKRHPADFALWKHADPEHILRWNSPWGDGFPGWHIECSAMSRKYLGPTFDIHGGGVDNLYPHNENEVVQSECANDADFARYWMLVGSLNVPDADGVPVKMSKSLGNFYTIKDALALQRAEVIRMFILSAHYSNPVVFSVDSLEGTRGGWERLHNGLRLVHHAMNQAPESDEGNAFAERLARARADFTAVMDDDFNAPRAIAVLQELTRDVNSFLNSDAGAGLPILGAIRDTIMALAGDVLGILRPGAEGDATGARQDDLIALLVELRADARLRKDYATSDRIRDSLAELGIVLEDRADGTVWKVN
jgi:cysteinyl-tRNA synthetase